VILAATHESAAKLVSREVLPSDGLDVQSLS
jgi:hypothetical protein